MRINSIDGAHRLTNTSVSDQNSKQVCEFFFFLTSTALPTDQ